MSPLVHWLKVYFYHETTRVRTVCLVSKKIKASQQLRCVEATALLNGQFLLVVVWMFIFDFQKRGLLEGLISSVTRCNEPRLLNSFAVYKTDGIGLVLSNS